MAEISCWQLLNRSSKLLWIVCSYIALWSLTISRDKITTWLWQKLYKHSQCPLIEPIYGPRYHANNCSIVLLIINSYELYAALWSLYLAVKTSLARNSCRVFSTHLLIIKLEIITFHTNKRKSFASHNLFLISMNLSFNHFYCYGLDNHIIVRLQTNSIS